MYTCISFVSGGTKGPDLLVERYLSRDLRPAFLMDGASSPTLDTQTAQLRPQTPRHWNENLPVKEPTQLRQVFSLCWIRHLPAPQPAWK